MINIARVFATKTKMCPIDKDSYFSSPDLFTPHYDEVHISVTFTWAIKRGDWLQREWGKVCDNVKIGGPVFGSGNEFIGGMYLRKGVTITSRGCLFNCPWCFVPEREGKIRELPIVEGNIIQDNNLLACSQSHIDKVFQMLSLQKKIDFPGGLDSRFITDNIIEKLRGLNIYQIWLAYDNPDQERPLIRAVDKLRKYFNRNQIRCYVLVGYENDTLDKAKTRLRRAWEIGTLPFAMRYRNDRGVIFKERDWNILQWKWTRPAIIKAIMQND